METVIVMIIVVWFLSAIVRSKNNQRAEERRRREEAALKATQERLRRELRQQGKEQERMRKEQIRQAEELAKHEQMIKKLEYRMAQAEADIVNERERISGLYALLDIAESNQASAVPGSKQDEAAQRKIITLTAQIASAEKRIRKAEFTKATAEKKLAA